MIQKYIYKPGGEGGKQGWLETVNTAPRCSTYKYFKTMLNPEKYFNMDLSYTQRKQFAKLRCSSHKFNIELGRHIGTRREDRLCYFCLQNRNIICIEDKFHAFFQCLRFRDLRTKY